MCSRRGWATAGADWVAVRQGSGRFEAGGRGADAAPTPERVPAQIPNFRQKYAVFMPIVFTIGFGIPVFAVWCASRHRRSQGGRTRRRARHGAHAVDVLACSLPAATLAQVAAEQAQDLTQQQPQWACSRTARRSSDLGLAGGVSRSKPAVCSRKAERPGADELPPLRVRPLPRLYLTTLACRCTLCNAPTTNTCSAAFQVLPVADVSVLRRVMITRCDKGNVEERKWGRQSRPVRAQPPQGASNESSQPWLLSRSLLPPLMHTRACSLSDGLSKAKGLPLTPRRRKGLRSSAPARPSRRWSPPPCQRRPFRTATPPPPLPPAPGKEATQSPGERGQEQAPTQPSLSAPRVGGPGGGGCCRPASAPAWAAGRSSQAA